MKDIQMSVIGSFADAYVGRCTVEKSSSEQMIAWASIYPCICSIDIWRTLKRSAHYSHECKSEIIATGSSLHDKKTDGPKKISVKVIVLVLNNCTRLKQLTRYESGFEAQKGTCRYSDYK